MEPDQQSKTFRVLLQLDYGDSNFANIIKNTLEVDAELKPQIISRSMEVNQTILYITYESADLRMLRTSLTGFFEMLQLATLTIKEFH